MPPPFPPTPGGTRRGGEHETVPLATRTLGERVDRTLDATTMLQVASALAKSAASVPADARARAARDLLATLQAELLVNVKPLRAGRLHYEIGRLLESPLGELAEAVEHFGKAHAALRDHLPSIRGARRVLLALGRTQEALPLFDAEIKLTADAERKAQLYYEKGSLLEDVLGQRREAHEAFDTALELGKGDASRVKGTERVAALARAWDDLSRALELEANAIQNDPRHRAAVIAARARLLESHRGDTGTATELYQRAVDGDSHALSALQALKRLQYGHQRFRDLVATLEREAELATDPGVRSLCYYRVGRLWLDRLGGVDEGLAALERASREAPEDAMILEELARAYELVKRPAELAATLEKLAESAASAAERLGHYQRIGELYEVHLGDETRAVSWYERARALDATYVPVLQALTKLYTKQADYEKLVEVYAGEADGVAEPARRAAAYARIAELYELHLDRPEEAMQQHARALGILPGHAPSFKALARLLTQAGKHPELIELYERAVDRATDAEIKVTYLYKIGRLYEDALESPEQAVVAYRRILEVAPQELGALHALQRACERAGLGEQLIDALEIEAERTGDRRRKLELFHRAGEVAETSLGDDALAISLFKRALELDKGYTPALASLGRMYYKAGRWEELLDTYKSELRLLGKGAALAALHFRMGQLYEEHLARDEEALQSYRRAVEADPSHRSAFRALERKLGAKGLNDELARLLLSELQSLDDPKLKARAALRIGELYESRLRAPERALEAYEQALAADPELSPARDGRVRLLTDAREFKGLVAELEREARLQRDPRLAVAAMFRAGEVFRDDLGEAGRAVQAFEAVLERDPAHLEALLALEPLYAERSAWDRLQETYATEARILQDPAARVGALRELGRLIAHGKVENPDRGRQAFGAMLQLAPADIGALGALERIALAEHDSGLLAHVDARLASIHPDAISIAAHETRLGELLEAAGDPQALEVYRAALARDPDAIGAARGISRIAEQMGDPALLEEAAEREARVHVEPGRAASVLMRAAERLSAAGNHERAAAGLVRALEIDPDHEQAAQRLRELLVPRGDVDRLLAVFTQAAGAAKKSLRSAGLWVEVAELQATHKRDLAAGLAALHRARTLEPNHVPSLLKLGELYARDAQWTEAAETYEQALDRELDAESAIEANLRLATLLDEHVDDAPKALKHLEAVLSREPNHRGALERLVSLHARRGDFDLAAETAARLVRVSPDAAGRVQALTLLARYERRRGQVDAAIHAYEQVIALVGMEGSSAEELRELLASSGSGEGSGYGRYVSALTRYAESSPSPGPAVFLELGRVLAARLSKLEEARGWLERGLLAHPEDVALHGELGAQLLKSGQPQRAITEAVRVLALDVQNEHAWRRMSEAFQSMQRPTEATLSIGPLVALGLANDAERATWSQRASRGAQALSGAFGDTEYAAVSAPANEPGPARLLSALGEIAGKVNPPELERWGVSGRDRVGSKSPNALRALTDRLAAVFGVGEYELYVHRAHNGLVEIELTDPVSVLVPASVTTLSEPEQAFLLGRVLVNVGRGLYALDRLSPNALDALLSAAARMVDAGYTAANIDEDYLAQQARRVGKALPWLGRGPIEDAARAYAQSPRIDIAEWSFAARLTAARAASIVADDLPSSVSLVRRLEGDMSGAEGAPLALGVRLTHDLLRFWVSEPALVLRRRLGLV